MMKHNASAGSTRLLHRFVAALLSLALLAAVTAYLVDSSFNPFLYFRF